MKKYLIILLTFALTSCNSSAQKQKAETSEFPITKSEEEWKKILKEEEFNVLRKEGTEPRFSSPLNSNYEEGIYVCAACETPLFKSEHKFDSGTGWPSFDREIEGNVAYSKGSFNSYYGVEEHCAICGGHLGHVFNDGPRETTGKRHCINGVALDFIPKE